MGCAKDRSGHGTHCAGTVGSLRFGVASSVQLHAVKVLDDSGVGTWTDFVEGVEYVTTVADKPAVISASLGGSGHIEAVKDVIDMATRSRVVVVVAAGNENQDACEFSPAFAPSAITVGSIDKHDKRSSFSNFGKCVDIFAPGSSITSLDLQEGKTATGSGTSMAAPHVAGAVAILLSDPGVREPVETQIVSNALNNVLFDVGQPGTQNKLLHIGISEKREAHRFRPLIPPLFQPWWQWPSYRGWPVKSPPPAIKSGPPIDTMYNTY